MIFLTMNVCCSACVPPLMATDAKNMHSRKVTRTGV